MDTKTWSRCQTGLNRSQPGLSSGFINIIKMREKNEKIIKHLICKNIAIREKIPTEGSVSVCQHTSFNYFINLLFLRL